MSDLKDSYENLVLRLEGLSSWGTLAGIAGWHLEFGQPSEWYGPGNFGGELSLWIRTGFRVVNKRALVMQRGFPLEEDFSQLSELFDNNRVTGAGIDPEYNSLRLLFGETCLLSVFPGPAGADLPWILFNRHLKPVGNLVVFKDSFEGSLK